MAPPAPTYPLEMLSWSRRSVLFQQSWVWCPKLWCSSLELKGELVVGLQQKCPSILDVLCCSRWSIIHLYPNSWVSDMLRDMLSHVLP